MTTATTKALVADVVIEAKFPRVSGGDECEGRLISRGAERLGLIARVFEAKDIGFATARYQNMTVGYRFENWVTEEDREYPTLREAMAAARAAFSK